MLVATLARALVERGHGVEIFAGGANPDLGVSFRELAAWDPAGFDITHTFSADSLSREQVRRCHRVGTRVLHSCFFNALVLAAMSRRFLKQLRHGWYRSCLWGEMRAGHLSDGVTMVSDRVASEFAWVYATPRARLARLPNCHPGTPADPNGAARLRERFGFTKRERVFLFAGRDEDPIKRADLVQSCFLRLHHDFPDSRLWMMPGTSAVWHPAIVPAGRLSVAEGELIYQAADFFVNASLYDGMPLSVLQALAAGLPTIATAAGGSEEVITHGRDGLLLPRSAAGLEAAMRRLASDDSLCATLSGGARACAEAFAPEPVAARLEGIYFRLLG
jgi:glycosyltransferase involved in cell wall biosynthesis